MTDESDAGTTVRIQDVWMEVRALQRHRLMSSRYSRIARTIEPMIGFLERFSPAVDSMVQYGNSPATLIWGTLKVMLVIAQTSITYFYFIDTAMVKLNDVLSISLQYERMFVEVARVQNVLSDLYTEIYIFLEKIRKTVTKSSWHVFLANVRKSFDSEFGANISRIERCSTVFNDEITLAYRQRQDTASKKLETLVQSVSKDNKRSRDEDDARENDSLRSSVLRWLTNVDSYEDLHRTLKRRSTGTGQQFLDLKSFRQWRDRLDPLNNSPIIWVYGRPGSGKTVLCSTMIEHLQEHCAGIPVTYFFCDSGDVQKKSILNVCSSILAQIALQMETFPQTLVEAYTTAKRHGRQSVSASDNLSLVLKKILASVPGAYIVVDAIDECDDAAELARTLAGIAQDTRTVQLACFSRDMRSIRGELAGATLIHLNTALMQPDINTYLSTSMDQLPGKGTTALDEAFHRLSRAADGMFLFAYLGVQSLKEAVDLRDIADAMRTIPAGLDGAYGQILERMASQSLRRRVLARLILLWVCCSTRPLSWDELQMALSWDETSEDFLESQRPFQDAVLDLCSPLVEYRQVKGTFHVAHFSVREFLCSVHESSPLSALARQFLIKEREAHHHIATVALATLSLPSAIHAVTVESLNPLVLYATENWCFHLSSSSFDSSLFQRYEAFAESQQARSSWITRFLISNRQSSPLYQIAKLQKLVRRWKNQSTQTEDVFHAEDLADIQRALIDLDQLPSSANHGDNVTNFERNLVVRDLARAYSLSGKLDQGIALFSSALDQVKQSRGDEALETAWLLNSLGILYDQQGLTKRAMDTQRQALKVQEKHLPHHHLETMLTINELGRVTRHFRQFEESKAFHLRALRIMREILPETDPQIIWSINTLARTYREAGEVDEALKLHRQALGGQTQQMSANHPHVLWTMGDIAYCLRDQGNYQDAIAMMQEVYEGRKHVLGPMHPDTVRTLEYVRSLCRDMEKSK